MWQLFAQTDLAADAGAIVVFLCMIGLAVCAYMAPFLIAGMRGHRQTMAIGALNLLLGWTFLGWVVALVWSLTHPR